MTPTTVFNAICTKGRRREDLPFVPRPCLTPTNAPAGSAEKIEVLAARLAAGVELFHPLDSAAPRPPRYDNQQKNTERKNAEREAALTIRMADIICPDDRQ